MNLQEKLLKITEEAQAIEKKGWNEFNRYKYVRAIDVVAEVQKLLVKHQVLMNIIEQDLKREIHPGKKGPNFHSTLTCLATFTNAEKLDEKEDVKYYAIASDVLDKDIYKAKTNGLKYLLTQKFMIVTDLVVDAEANSKQTNKADVVSTPKVYGICSKCDGHLYLAKGKLFCQNWKDKKEHDVVEYDGREAVPEFILEEGLLNVMNWLNLHKTGAKNEG